MAVGTLIMKKTRLFNDKGHPHGTVILNWHGSPEEEFTYFARSYHQVARNAATMLEKNPRFGLQGSRMDDFSAYPIVFLYRHCLELYMKAVILAGSGMVRLTGLGNVNEVHLRETHSLDSLREELELVFKAYNWDWDLGVPRFQTVTDFRRIISDFQVVDARSFSFRYPIDTDCVASLPSHFRFNLFEFCEILDALFPVLDGAPYLAYEEFQAECEARAEAREFEAH